MTFNSIIFIIFFLPIFLLSFFICKKKYRYIVLLIASLVIYSYSGLFNFNVLMTISIVNYILIKIFNNKKNREKYLKLLAILNLITLFAFKFNNSILLPLGISFYTFNNIMYIMDIKRKKISPEKNFFYYLTYVTCFIHITMGPLINYDKIKEKIQNLSPTKEEFYNGYKRFLYGFIKKIIIADNLGLLYMNIKSMESCTIFSNISLMVIFGLQLFIDFSSYTDMAIGLGKMIGLSYPENFDHPYHSTSISDFWRRWHMSLNYFIKYYIYIPLGGNRVSKKRFKLNLLIVWTLTGLWHGTTLNYILWGLYYFIILIIEKNYLKNFINKQPNIIKHLYVLFIIFIGNILFSFTNIREMLFYIQNFITKGFINNDILFYIKENIILLIIGIILCTYIPDKIIELTRKNKIYDLLTNIVLVILFIISIAYLINGSYSPFLYNAF